MNSEVLRLSRVTYRDRDNVFLRDYDLEVRSGEIMGLVPLNMYGLPALLDVILYNPQLYYGTVYYMGEVVNSWHEIERSPNPITVVDNVSSLVAGQSVVTNIYELSPNSPYYIQERKLERELQPYLDEIGVNISPRTRVEDLTAFERVVVEILRGVIWGHKLIVLREVSAYIGENKMEQLYGIMDWCRENGISFLYISSHYDEIQAICDRTALMSNGRILMKLDREMTEDLLEEICIKEYQDHEIFRKKNGPGEAGSAGGPETAGGAAGIAIGPEKAGGASGPVLEIRALEGETFGKTDIPIYRGEYLVIHAPDIRIFEELVQIIFGDKPGSYVTMLIGGERIYDPQMTREAAYLRANPDESMVFDKMSYMDNLLLTSDHMAKSVWSRGGVKKSIRQEFSDLLGEDVFSKDVDTLSQRERIILVYTRVLLQHPRAVFCEMPFNDVDTQTKLLIRDMQKRLNESGIAVAVLTMNLNENVLEADRVIRIGGK